MYVDEKMCVCVMRWDDMGGDVMICKDMRECNILVNWFKCDPCCFMKFVL